MKLAFIGGGVVGRCYGQAFAKQGIALCGVWDAQASVALTEFAAENATILYTSPGPWLMEADVVVSAVFGSVALDVFQQALPFVRKEALFVDMTTADPEDMQRAEVLARAAGLHFVDIGIAGAVNLQGEKTPLLCAGERAADVATLFASVGAPIQVVSRRAGDAASLKLLRSIFTKGLEALSVECLMTAQRRGLTAELHQILSDIDQACLKTMMESMVCTHIVHASRRQKEVMEAQRQMIGAGLTPLVTPAVEQLFERTAQRQLRDPYQGQSIDEALAWLTQSAALPA